MNISSSNEQLETYLRSRGIANIRPKTGFAENWLTAMHMNWYEGMSNSRSRVLRERTEKRNSILVQAKRDGLIPEKVFNGYRTGVGRDGVDWKHLAIYAKKHHGFLNEYYGTEIKTDDEIMEEIRTDLKHHRRYAEDIFARQSMLGMGGEFAGYANTDALDPFLIPGFFVGYGQAALSAKFLTAVVKTGVKVGAAEAFLEGVRQVPVYNWKHDIGAEYDVTDALSAILTTGLVAGGLGASAEAAALGMRKLAESVTSKTKAALWARQSLDSMAREMDEASILEKDAITVAQRMEEEVARQQDLPMSRYKGWDRTNLPQRAVVTEYTDINITDMPTSKAEVKTRFKREDIPALQRAYNDFSKKMKDLKGQERLDMAQARSLVQDAINVLNKDIEKVGKVGNVTQPGVDYTNIADEVVDAAYDDLVATTPDAEIPVEVVSKTEVKTSKASDVVKEQEGDFEIANKLKECLTNGS